MEIGNPLLPTTLRGACIDIDGTLANSLSSLFHIYMQFLSDHHIQGSRKEFEELNGPTLKQIFQILNLRYDLKLQASMVEKQYSALLAKEYEKMPDLFPGAKETISYLQKKAVPLAIVSACSYGFAEKFLKTHGIFSAFSAFSTGDQITYGKPAPDIYERALLKLGCVANETFAVEDSLNGVTAATEAGIPTFWIFSNNYATQENKQEIYPVADWWALLNILKKQYGPT